MEWNYNGSMLGVISKDKLMKIYDPRVETSVISVSSHEGVKPKKICWLGETQKILTTGFSKTNDR
jgi:hypothetical protein